MAVSLIEVTQGDATVTFGFQPTLVLTWSSAQTANGTSTGARMMFGAMDAAGTHRCAFGGNNDGTNGTAAGYRNALFFIHDVAANNTGPALDGILALATATLTGTGLTLDWSTANDGTARKYFALGISSTEVTTSRLFSRQYPTSAQWWSHAENWDYTPDALIHFGAYDSTIAGDEQSTTSVHHMKLAAVDWRLQQFLALNRGYGSGAKYAQWGHALGAINTSTTVSQLGYIRDLYRGGMIAEMTAASLSQQFFSGYVLVKMASGYDLQIGTFNSTTGGTTQDVSVNGTPKAVVVCGVNATSFTSGTATNADCRMSIGGSDGTNQGAVWSGKTTTSDPADSYHYNTHSIIHATEGTPTLNNQASMAFAAGKFSLTWTGTPASALQWFHIAICQRTDLTSGYGFVRILEPNTSDPRSIYYAVTGVTPTRGDEFEWDDNSGHAIDQFGMITGPVGSFSARYRPADAAWTSAATITLGSGSSAGHSGPIHGHISSPIRSAVRGIIH